ncbi:MAG: TIGR01548 family HAD-type hydrolase [Oculatellaceae cyanobacterium bins.114]|nr:TIGR01548 family HAD-type hydrolase [Oculatellaceae cyanobacterium bins.114]
MLKILIWECEEVVQQGEQQAVKAIVVFDIDGVIRDVGGSYRRALADTVEHYTDQAYRPSMQDIDALKSEGVWNNDWEASREMIDRYRKQQGRDDPSGETVLSYQDIVAFFQSRYRGPDPDHWTGYICDEPLLLRPSYLESLTQADMRWGFFSGATRGSASYVLEKRLGLRSPTLVAMEDAPGKPDPTGLFDTIQQLEPQDTAPIPVIYVGDTVADMQTVKNAQQVYSLRQWIGVGILPPHAQNPPEYAATYTKTLEQSGATIVLTNVEQLTPTLVLELLQK